MHEIVREYLEEHLRSKETSGRLSDFHAHLSICGPCREMVKRMEETSQLFDVLRLRAEQEPGPGFYVRVMNRIDAEKRPSAWSLLLDPIFGKRLVYASLTVVVLLGTYMFSSENAEMANASGPEVILSNQGSTATVAPAAEGDRDVILVNLATYKD
jgi:predicted anti-sigma-YlaC factor YlaD